MLPFHETLERFWRFNFSDEIGRLGLDAPSAVEGSVSHTHDSVMSTHSHTGPRSRQNEAGVGSVPPFQREDSAGRESVDAHRSQYAVDVNSRLSKVVAGPDLKPAMLSPLQRHISTLHRKSANLMALASQHQQQAEPPASGGSDAFSLKSGRTYTGLSPDGGDVGSTTLPPTPTPGPGTATAMSRYEVSVHEAASVAPGPRSPPPLVQGFLAPSKADQGAPSAGGASSVSSSTGNRLSRLIRGARRNLS